MDLTLIIAAVLAATAILVVLAVGAAAARARRREDSRVEALMGLAKVRSPSGKAFFPTDDSVLELAELLDDVEERRRREGPR